MYKPKLVCIDLNGTIPDLSDEFDILIPQDARLPGIPDAVLLWNDVLDAEVNICRKAREIGIPTFVMQHSGPFLNPDYTVYTHNKKHPVADYTFVWSETWREIHERDGFRPEQIIPIGCSLLRFQIPWERDGQTVVFAPNHKHDLGQNDVRNLSEAIEAWDRVQKIPGIRPIAKLLAYDHSVLDFSGDFVITNRVLGDDHLKTTFKLLSKASCVVVQEEETFSFLASKMDIPQIKLKNIYPKKTDSVLEVDLADLPQAIHQALKSPKLRRRERKEYADRTADGFDRDKMVKIIKSIIAKNETKVMVAA